ncbi:MAG: hypothetical protein KIY12_03295, partial [Thermoplasmata archaeon]|nr:hypothetical protein [Candidatus Sysuiplasma superficiale]
DLWPATAWLIAGELRYLGRTDEAIAEVRRALASDPTDLKVAKTGLAVAAEAGRAADRRQFSLLIRGMGLK